MSAAKRKGSAFGAQVVGYLREHQRAGDPMSPEPPEAVP